jgi:hypothetical protein
MRDLLKFLYTAFLIIGGLTMWSYSIWQANHGKWAEAAFWMVFSVSIETSINRTLDGK